MNTLLQINFSPFSRQGRSSRRADQFVAARDHRARLAA